MKKGIHPETYRLVAFKDMSNETVFITRSCAPTKETIEVEGVEYPVVKIEISNTSHPFPILSEIQEQKEISSFCTGRKKPCSNRIRAFMFMPPGGCFVVRRAVKSC